jgi:Uma2 family endonuclease
MYLNVFVTLKSMWPAIEHPPRTMMEVYKILPEGTLAEIINGSIYMSASPVRKHQEVVGQLFSQMYPYVSENELGQLFIAPFDVYLDEHANAVQPDIIFVSKEREHIIQDHIHGVPDLLVEILSPGNPSHDLMLKKNLYEKFGVKEYWVVDPVSKEVNGYLLVNNRFEAIAARPGILSSKILKRDFKC